MDRHIDAKLGEAEKSPGAAADDSEFLRRVSLDLIGRIPTLAETRAFLEDGRKDKRERLVDRLLDSPEFARHFATVLRRAWLPQLDTPSFIGLTDDYEAWLRDELGRGTPYDKLVRAQLLAPVVPSRAARSDASRSFLLAGELKPETLAGNAMRSFLGVNLDCAQCHNHPFARWTRDEFWQTAAFFTVPTGKENSLAISIPGTDRRIAAKHLNRDGPAAATDGSESSGRQAFSKWATSPDNAYFAKNAVNRIWSHLLGTGLVEPLDDHSAENPPSHPELLDELAEGFVRSKYDVKFVLKALTLSRVYRRSSADAGRSESDRRLFARGPVRPLTGEQLYDSLLVAGGKTPPSTTDGIWSDRGRFAARFLNTRAGAAERSVPQALTMHNGDLVADLTRTGKSPILKVVAESPFLDDGGRVETLYLATLNRKPTADERAGLLKHLTAQKLPADRERAFADIFWALLNGAEFNTNH